ncbi:PfkB family carbohydrate kinase [Bowmanella dokdonensis]|uniref:Carbohydrate kinase n=1 Tax=Bowmanella dokdonensis TaxID=751969 RepID=A0A939DNL7_9ALTE|nr:carbohydrate kinase [Bowmanella dokdonensis]
MRVICPGEMLIDFVCLEAGKELSQGETFVRKPGGAPANVAACIARLGGEASFVGALGSDGFGDYLFGQLERYGVERCGVQRVDKPTTMAFVSRREDGEREFQFNRGADAELTLSQQQVEDLLDNSILHLGAATAFLPGPLRQSYLQLARRARQRQQIICFDPNYRQDLWSGNPKQFVKDCHSLLALANLVKVSEEELELLSGESDLEAACQTLLQMGPELILVTRGSEGCLLCSAGQSQMIPASSVKVVDTTGAGDAFIGAFLYQVARLPEPGAYLEHAAAFTAFAIRVSGLVCTRLGAMTALPTLEEVSRRS